jgi:hypothetical protein
MFYWFLLVVFVYKREFFEMTIEMILTNDANI